MDIKTKRIIFFPIIALIIAVFVVADVLAVIFYRQITNVLVGTGEDFSNATEVLEESDALVRTLAEDSVVLLKNQEDADGEAALPLTQDDETDGAMKVNLFGFSAYDPTNAADFDGFLMKGIGSGSSTIAEDKAVTLQDALDEYFIEYNPDLEAIYDAYDPGRYFISNSNNDAYWLDEPTITEEQYQQAQEYSDIAVVVFSRLGGENIGEQPQQQTSGSVNRNKTYLEITDAEQTLLNNVTDRFGKVIVILNTSNVMHCGFLDDADVDAAMYVGLTGQSGAIAIPEILLGYREYEDDDGQFVREEFSPSGKVSDTYIYVPDYDPSFDNTVSQNTATGINIQYLEDIYFGYKWYETADAEGYFNNVENEYGTGYDAVVQYPFGYGLSYTTFEWEVMNDDLGDEGQIGDSNKNEEITITVRVTNTGDYPGKDVVELYYTPQYWLGEVEKAEVNLLDFGKTTLLQPGESEDVELTFTPYDMASFDAYNRNKNNASTYELDEGTYTISLRSDAHTLKLNEDGEEVFVYDYELADDVIYTTDPVTGTELETKFTGDTAYAGVPIDGSTVGASTQYLSRENFGTTFPERATAPTNTTLVNQASSWTESDRYANATMPTMGTVTTDDGQPLSLTVQNAEGGLEYNMELFETLIDYDAPEWEDLLNQLTASELTDLVNVSGFRIDAMDSVGSPARWDYDGPAGFNINSQVGNWEGSPSDNGSWTAYPCECLLGCSWNKTLLLQMGLSMGAEGAATNIDGWYAPGINLHRTNYTSRNYEYYSEDAVLSGNLAAQVILGAKINGMYCYMKHFVVSESGPNGRDWNTWLTEQNLRENYLKPFEIAVKEGEANAVMSSFNNLGATWTGANYALLTEILREEWGFEGTVITDWFANDACMDPRQGVLAGNDIWLAMNPGSNNISSSNVAQMTAARRAAHNVLYTMVDTVYFNANFDDSTLEGMLTVNKGISTRDIGFVWWVPVVVVVEVLVFGALGVWVFFLVKPRKKPVDPNAGTDAGLTE